MPGAAEGHTIRGRGVDGSDQEVEGHGFQSGRVETDEDTEGHGRFNVSKRTAPARAESAGRGGSVVT